MKDEFRWNTWNREHATKHGVSIDDAQHVVRFARRPYPQRTEDDKWLVRGQASDGRFVQAFVLDEDQTIYIIHARPLTENERRQLRRRRR